MSRSVSIREAMSVVHSSSELNLGLFPFSFFFFFNLRNLFPPSYSDAEDWENLWSNCRLPWDTGEAHPQLVHLLNSGRLNPSLQRTSSVLIPGAGSGYESVALASHGWNVTCVDISATAVEQASKKLDDMGLEYRDR